MSSSSYKDAGVDLDLYQETMARLPALLKSTHTPRVMDLQGGFAGLFRLQGDGQKYEDPVLVSGSDGVGTKLKVAIMSGRFNTVGIDLVAMCVNDCLCIGAEPLFFLDYLALGKDDPALVEQLVEGISTGCGQAGAALLGGETAIMPDLYAEGDFDMAGFCVGVCERDALIDGTAIGPGDRILGIHSNGFHSNGYSLIRKIVFERCGLAAKDHVEELGGSVADTLMKPTKIYASEVALLMERFGGDIHGLAHITGGGIAENLERLLPGDAELRIEVQRGSWPVPDEMTWLQQKGDVEQLEMERVFNMGIGLAVIVAADAFDAACESLDAESIAYSEIGRVLAGERSAEVVN